jgi:membrane protein
MIGKAWVLVKDMVSGFIEHEDLSRGGAIAYYTIFSIAPLLIIVIAIAGLVFGHDAAQGAIVGQLRGLIGKQSAEILQSMIQSASHETTGVFATVIGVGTRLLTSTGVSPRSNRRLTRFGRPRLQRDFPHSSARV